MARLSVRLNGQLIVELELHDGQEYLAGRADDAAIVLPNQKNISRHHLKFYQDNDAWCVELLAKYGTIQVGGQSQKSLALKQDCIFSAPPFEFHFSLLSAEKAGEPEKSLPAIRNPNQPAEVTSTPPPDAQPNNDATLAGRGEVLPFLRIKTKGKGKEEILRLEGQLWVAGRESNCEIFLDDHRASRRHFEISRTMEGYFITDLGSANGTLLNEEPITPNEPWQLTSGDTLRVSGVKMSFEIRDMDFHNRVPAIITAAPIDPMTYNTEPAPFPQLSESGSDVGDQSQWNPRRLKTLDYRRHRVHIALLALLPLLLWGLFHDSTSTPPSKEQTEIPSTSPTFDQLTPEKKRAVKDSFELAKTMYMQQKYSLCISELVKLLQLVPAYENSTELQIFCRQGEELLRKQHDDQVKVEKAEATNRRIELIVSDCQSQLPPGASVSQTRACLTTAIELDPEHPLIIKALDGAQSFADNRERQVASADAERQRMQRAQKLFQSARSLFKAGELAKSLNAYQKFLDLNHPGLKEESGQARREVAQVRLELDKKVASQLTECKGFIEKSQFSPAVKSCDQALREDPGHAEAKRLRAQAWSELRRELKSTYEDSVLEESMGNIDSAKERWKQIMDKSNPADDYYIKSERNLKKYGVGM
jgi:pSer/pThr/pTyr-binding forkhead associated (FHA) protein/tetratricopeptide (TPR) repeat protein